MSKPNQTGRLTSLTLSLLLAAVVYLVIGRVSWALATAAIALALFRLRASSPSLLPRGKAAHVAFSILFLVYVTGTIIFLLAGLLPALVHAFPSWHQELHEFGAANNALSNLARNAAEASHSTESAEQILVSYMFSAISIGLGIFLVRLRPHDAAARLLATGMIGTAALFNLQAHNALTVLPILAGAFHNLFHLVTGVAYVVALMLFPTGRFVPRWEHLRWYQWPLRIAFVLILVMSAVVIVENFHGDNPTGWVVFFGILVPVAGISSQLSRYRHPATAVERQQSRILVLALLVALGATLVWVAGYSILSQPGRPLSKTATYEFESPSPGRYFFVCDPHPDMEGTVVVVRDDSLPRVVPMAAEDYEFNTARLRLPARARVMISFTNRDGDAHNVAIYRNRSSNRLVDPIFVGRLFSAHGLAELAFVVFPGLFAVIPTTLFAVLVQYRLWDMDRIINRTLVYGGLTAVLAVVYALCVVVVPRAVGLGGRSEIVVAGSTLLVAALFQPARRRIQKFIDRRFYRSRYDAARTVEAFSHRLRDEVNLEAMRADLVAAVQETMQPQGISVWLKRELTSGHGRS